MEIHLESISFWDTVEPERGFRLNMKPEASLFGFVPGEREGMDTWKWAVGFFLLFLQLQGKFPAHKFLDKIWTQFTSYAVEFLSFE